MRRGPNGGLLICEPDAAPATHAIIIYLEYLGITIGDLLDARLLLEPLAASRAAQQIDEAGIDRLRAVLRAEQDRQPIRPTSSMPRWPSSPKTRCCNCLSTSSCG